MAGLIGDLKDFQLTPVQDIDQSLLTQALQRQIQWFLNTQYECIWKIESKCYLCQVELCLPNKTYNPLELWSQTLQKSLHTVASVAGLHWLQPG